MSWALYNEIKGLHDRGHFDRALSLIAGNRKDLSSIQPHATGLEASCYSKMGKDQTAKSLLLDLIQSSKANFWTFYQIANVYRRLGLSNESMMAYQQAHELQGWNESRRNNYMFSHDYFSPNIIRWEEWFRDIITTAPIQCLEIGSWQGGSATWLLDRVVSKRGGSITCVDTFQGSSEHQKWIGGLKRTIEQQFDYNVSATGHSEMCRKIVGQSQTVLRGLPIGGFDFVYIDGAHEAEYVMQDSVLSWSLVKDGGFLLWDDVDFTFPSNPASNTKVALDAFKKVFTGSIDIVYEGRQLLVRKRMSAFGSQ